MSTLSLVRTSDGDEKSEEELQRSLHFVTEAVNMCAQLLAIGEALLLRVLIKHVFPDVRRVNHLAAMAPSECAQLWTLSTQTLVHVAAYLSVCLQIHSNASTNMEQRDLLQQCADTLLKALCAHDDDERQLQSFLSLSKHFSLTFADASRRSINDTVYDEDDDDNEETAKGARRRRQVPSAPPTNIDTLTQVQLGAFMLLEEVLDESILFLACTSSARHACHHAHMTKVDISFQPLLDAVLHTLRAMNASTDTCDDPRNEQFECAPLVGTLFILQQDTE